MSGNKSLVVRGSAGKLRLSSDRRHPGDSSVPEPIIIEICPIK
jgi:hypothetical protein